MPNQIGVLYCGFQWPVALERWFAASSLSASQLAMDAGKLSAEESYAIAMHGAPALPADFTHMPYANPDAPKGGRLVQGILGTFDSLNPLIVRGSPCSRSGDLWSKA